MLHTLTCPHCENALTHRATEHAAQLVCPSCQGRLPNPRASADAADSTLAEAVAVDDDLPIGHRHPNFGCFIQTGLVGVVMLAGMIGFGLGLLPQPWGASVARLAYSLLGSLGVYGVGHALLAARTAACRQIGWFVLAVYAALGAAGFIAFAVSVLLLIIHAVLDS